MKRILIFCDGTWNSPTIPQPTNVHALCKAAVESDDQMCLYFPGVGTGGRVSNFIGKWINKIGGGAFGWGLNRNIKVAYAALAETYDPGDQIMIFGFSRGAFTARSLAGMIRKCGLLDKETVTRRRVNKAFRLYRKRGSKNRPDTMHIWRQRQELSPTYATSQKDQEMRADGSQVIEITYLGIWETVGALGIPETLLGPLAKLVNTRYQFHDTDLSSMVKHARHALALDERRKFYKPAKWGNLDHIGTGPGLNQGNTGANRPYQQIWFIGSHPIVGGSSTVRPLVAYGLDWITKGAMHHGVTLNPSAVLPDATPNANVDAGEISDPGGIYNIAPKLLEWRDGPTKKSDRHASVDTRLDHDPQYRPRTMRALRPDLWP